MEWILMHFIRITRIVVHFQLAPFESIYLVFFLLESHIVGVVRQSYGKHIEYHFYVVFTDLNWAQGHGVARILLTQSVLNVYGKINLNNDDTV